LAEEETHEPSPGKYRRQDGLRRGSFRFLPVILAVLGMRHESSDVRLTSVVVHRHHQPIVVSFHIEDRQCSPAPGNDRIGMRINETNVLNVFPARMPHSGGELLKPFGRVRILCRKLAKRRFLDDPHSYTG
jgi:hypothetical protein